MNIEEKEALFKEFISTIAFNPSSLYAKKLKKKIMSLDKQEDLKHFIELLNNRINEIKKIEEQKIIDEEKKLEKERSLKNKNKISKYYYSDEDLCYLKDALENKEISIIDLTYDEAIALNVSSKYRNALRIVYSKLILTKEQDQRYDKIHNSLNNKDTSLRVILNMYKEAKKK